MGQGRNQTVDLWICSQTHYPLRYAAQYKFNDDLETKSTSSNHKENNHQSFKIILILEKVMVLHPGEQ